MIFSKFKPTLSKVPTQKNNNFISILHKNDVPKVGDHCQITKYFYSLGDRLSNGRHQEPALSMWSCHDTISGPIHCQAMWSSIYRQKDFNCWKINQDLLRCKTQSFWSILDSKRGADTKVDVDFE